MPTVNWNQVTSVEVLPGGASGRVALFHFGSPPKVVKFGSKPKSTAKIVKAGQYNAAEVVLAATLINDMAFASGKFTIKAPMSHIADDAERAAIRAALGPPLRDGGWERLVGNPRGFPTALTDNAPVVVAAEMGGVTVRKLLTQNTFKIGRIGRIGRKDRIRPDSVLAMLMTEPDAMIVLGQATAADIVMGNGDRLAEAINLENFMFDADSKTFSYVDNTNKGPAGYLTQSTTRDRGVERTTSAEGAFLAWTQKHFVGTVHPATAADSQAAARTLAESVIGLFISDRDGVWFELDQARKVRTAVATEEEKPAIQQEFETQVALVRAAFTGAVIRGMTESFATGLVQGLGMVVARLREPDVLEALVSSLPDRRQQHEAKVSLLARARFLSGEPAEGAWERAVRDIPLPRRELRPPPPNFAPMAVERRPQKPVPTPPDSPREVEPAAAVERAPQKPVPPTPPDSPPDSPREVEPAAAVERAPRKPLPPTPTGLPPDSDQ